MASHSYLPPSEDKRGLKDTVLWTVLSVVVRVATVTLPGTPLNSLPPLNHLRLTPISLVLTTPGNWISHTRVISLPTYGTLLSLISRVSDGGGTAEEIPVAAHRYEELMFHHLLMTVTLRVYTYFHLGLSQVYSVCMPTCFLSDKLSVPRSTYMH